MRINRNFILNIIVPTLSKIILTLIIFYERSLFINLLGIELSGINNTLKNIITTLTIIDLGMTDAFLYHLYTYEKNKDEKHVWAIVGHYRKCMRMIAFILLIVGVMVCPLLKYVFQDTYIGIGTIILCFMIMLIRPIINYALEYKKIIFFLKEKIYIFTIWHTISKVMSLIISILIIKYTQDYILYLVLQTLMESVVYEIGFNILCHKIYKKIKYEQLESVEKAQINQSIRSLASVRFGQVIFDYTDNILISMFMGSKAVGIFSNYSLVLEKLRTYLIDILNAETPQIGITNTSDDDEIKYATFENIFYLNYYLYSFVGICFITMIDDLVNVWIGNGYNLKYIVVIMMVFNYFLRGLYETTYIYRKTTNLFEKTKNLIYIAAALNIIISVILGKPFGITGILLGSIISNIMTIYFYEPYLLYRDYFHKNFSKYIFMIISSITKMSISVTIIRFITNYIKADSWIRLLLKGIICLIISLFMLYITSNKKEKDAIKKILKYTKERRKTTE